jgi:cellobiose epimerase
MNGAERVRSLEAELRRELTGNILPYWMTRALDDEHGGFVGLITGDEAPVKDAPKGAVLNARILWTFSAAHRVLGDPRYRVMADRALDSIRAHFIDRERGGVYWMVDATGSPLDLRKHVYAQAFTLYALAEYFRATADEGVLAEAIRLFRRVEEHARDPVSGGYVEAFSRDWEPLDDVRLSDEDANEPRSMNTHLHLLEAYTNLFRAWPDPLLRSRLQSLVRIFLDVIVDADTGHARAFFDDGWTPRSSTVSFGHDIEASWLLLEAADVVADPPLGAEVRDAAVRIADAVLSRGADPLGGVFNESGPDGAIDTDKVWWVQAEAIIGFFNAHQETGRPDFLQASLATWAFVKRHVRDPENGEWFRRVARDGTVMREHEKLGPWKCPYHNARACLEVIARVGEGDARPAHSPPVRRTADP